MTIKECYEQLGQNYEEVLDRLGSEVILKKFVIKFLDDSSFQMLEDGLKEKNADQAFRAAHTIKGICLNLGFDKLYQASSDLTEQLRGKDTVEETDDLFLKVKEQYTKLVEVVRKMAMEGQITEYRRTYFYAGSET